MRKFLTIFPYAKNVHLIKDVGMLPFILHKECGYHSTLASYKNGDYPYLDTEVKGLNHVFIPKIFRVSTIDIICFLIFNFRKYDIVQCYHFEKQSLLILAFFKLLKYLSFSNGFTFLKLDAVDRIKQKKLNIITKFLSKNINLISVETKQIFKYLNASNLLARKVEYVPNGFYINGIKELVSFAEKENLIITVGRIGIPEKNNELLLESFKDFALINKEWTLEIIGPVMFDFQIYIDNFFRIYPYLKERIYFSGPISNRIELRNRYEKAKIFVLTSREEGFPLVFLEAIHAGCSIISSNLTAAYDITDDEKYGALFNEGDAKDLTEKIGNVVSNSDKLKSDCNEIQLFAREKYSWNNIAITIDNLIK